MLSTMVESEGIGAAKDQKQQQQMAADSNRTWPKAHLSQRSLSELQQRIQLERAIRLARAKLIGRNDKAGLEGEEEEDEDKQQKTFEKIVAKMLNALEAIRNSKEKQMVSGSRKMMRGRRESLMTLGAAAGAPKEPHFGSMVLFGTLQRDQGKALQRGMALRQEMRGASLRRQSISILSDDVPSEPRPPDEEMGGRPATPLQMVYAGDDLDAGQPWWLRHCPVLTSLLCAVLLLSLGALVFQALDEQIGRQPYHRALTFAFQAVATIGWGDVRAENKWSQAFCALYTVVGVPVFFCALANVGRLFSPFYTIDWLFLTCVVRPPTNNAGGEMAVVQQQHIPLRKSLYLLSAHQLIGVILYGGLLKKYPPIAVIYFCVTSMATIGIGDFHPDAVNIAEAIVAIVFMSVGIGLLAALLIALAYHFQTLFFVHFRGWLLRRSTITIE